MGGVMAGRGRGYCRKRAELVQEMGGVMGEREGLIQDRKVGVAMGEVGGVSGENGRGYGG